MCSHVGGVHLAHLQLAKEWADRVGDTEFAAQCETFLILGAASGNEFVRRMEGKALFLL